MFEEKKKSAIYKWIFVICGFVLLYLIAYSLWINRLNYRGYFMGQHMIVQTRAKNVLEAAKETGKMPIKDKWCNEAIQHGWIIRRPRKLEDYPKWDLAYNANLSGKDYNNIPGETVLLWEANGPWNYSGGPELLKPKKLKDKYVGLFYVELDTVLVAFMDGSIARYRFPDKTIAVYNPDNREFAPFTTDSKYLPLRWQP
jgi:hypothetical protein